MATTAPPIYPFERRVNDAQLSKSDVNSLIMDYLIKEGYPSAAEKFAMEANIEQPSDDSSIVYRVQISNAIHRGDLEKAIELIGEVSPELLDQDAKLHFSLLRLQLVELIRASFTANSSKTNPTAIEKAILFAKENLAPYATVSDNFKTDLERAMALLIVPRENWTQPSRSASAPSTSSSQHNGFGQLSDLVDPSLRKKVAKAVNEALLASQGQGPEPGIRHLVRARAWAENLAHEKKVELPARLNLGLDGEDSTGNGHNGDAADSINNNGSTASTLAGNTGQSGRRTRATSGITDAVMTGTGGGPRS